MFEKLKEICKLKTKKEQPMSTPTEPRTIKKLNEKISNQSTEINKLRRRISSLVDDITIIKNDIKLFKTNVSGDLKNIVENIDNK